MFRLQQTQYNKAKYYIKGCNHMISYAPFWRTLENKGISQYTLIHTYNVSTGTLDALRKNKSTTLATIHDLCVLLDCDISDIVEVIKE